LRREWGRRKKRKKGLVVLGGEDPVAVEELFAGPFQRGKPHFPKTNTPTVKRKVAVEFLLKEGENRYGGGERRGKSPLPNMQAKKREGNSIFS